MKRFNHDRRKFNFGLYMLITAIGLALWVLFYWVYVAFKAWVSV